MKLTTPKDGNKNLYYVEGDSGESYKVVWVSKYDRLFCQCDDFFIRQLSDVAYDGTSSFAKCKHGEFVQQATIKAVLTYSAPVRLISAEQTAAGITIKTDRDEKPKTYEIWYVPNNKLTKPFKSLDMPGVFATREDAERTLQALKSYARYYEIRETR